ncbi:MAG: 50S ribosomal protein L6 [Candidatus Margulisbacteria bacterium]|nr:50S ribosomal protein L6 [Candidatus Margulisiibacteriota bacterium]
MGRIGKRIIEIPKGVEVKIEEGLVKVKGPKGEIAAGYRPQVKIVAEGGKVRTECASSDRKVLALQGLYNSLLFNMIEGVTKGFEKRLDLVGVGYRAAKQGKNLSLQMGFSHPVEIVPPEGIEIAVEGTSKVVIKGIDKQVVGELAANIRAIRPVEPYKGKGIRYEGEIVRKKAGKTAKAAGAA